MVDTVTPVVKESTKAVADTLGSKYFIWSYIKEVMPEVAAMAEAYGIAEQVAGMLEGAVLGDFIKDASVDAWTLVGQIGGNLIPVVDTGSDVRDFGAALKKLYDVQGKELGAWGNLGLNGARFVPMVGLFTFGPKVFKHWDEVKTAMKMLVMKNEAFAKVLRLVGKKWEDVKAFGNGVMVRIFKGETKTFKGAESKLAYDITKWGEHGLPRDGYFSKLVSEQDASYLLDGDLINLAGGKGAGFVGKAEELKGITSSQAMKDAMAVSYKPDYILEFQLKDFTGLQNLTKYDDPLFSYGGKTLGGFSEYNIPGLDSSKIVNWKLRRLE
jgi:hypothetical protein